MQTISSTEKVPRIIVFVCFQTNLSETFSIARCLFWYQHEALHVVHPFTIFSGRLLPYIRKYSATSHIRAVWDQGGPVIVKVPVSMNPLLPVYTLRHFTL